MTRSSSKVTKSRLFEVLQKLSRSRGENVLTVLESTPRGDSQSNGVAERAVQEVECAIRTHKLDLDSKLNVSTSVTENLMTWLVENAADILNKCQVGHDGRTAYERLKQKPHTGEFLAFGSKILHKVADKPQGGLMAPRWLPGI